MTKTSVKKEIEATRKGLITDFVGKLFATGTGALFMTEGAIRSVLSELKLPKEVANYVLEQAEKKKVELYAVISNELNKFLSALDVSKELSKTLEYFTIKFKAEVEFSPKSGVHSKKALLRAGKKKRQPIKNS